MALDKSKNKISKELKIMDEEFDKKTFIRRILKSKHLLKKKFQEYVLIYPINYERILGEKSKSTSTDFEKTKDL